MKAELNKLRVVLDTNIFISALGFEGDTAAQIWNLAEDGRFEVYASPFILEELERNLIKKAKFSLSEARDTTAQIKDVAYVFEPKAKISTIQEKDSDNRILECAVEAKADVIVTGNMKHIRPLGHFQGIAIMTPREFLNHYFPNLG